MIAKKIKLFSIAISSAAVASVTILLTASQDASAGTPVSTAEICFRGRTIVVPTYTIPRYVAAGATTGPCQITPSL